MTFETVIPDLKKQILYLVQFMLINVNENFFVGFLTLTRPRGMG